MIGLLQEALLGVTGQSSPTTTLPPCSVAKDGSKVTGVCTAVNSLHIPIAYRSILPILVLGVGALLLLAVSAVIPKRSRPGFYPLLTVIIGGLALAASIWQWNDIGDHGAQITIGTQVYYDRFSAFFMVLFSVATILSAVTADSYLRREGLDGVEAYVLMLMAGTGAMLMAVSAGLIMLFLGLEIMSISLYVMAAYHRRRSQSGEAGLKYFVLGAFSSAIFLYGVALVYGATGSTQFQDMANFLAANSLSNNGVLLAGMGLLIVGLGFKVAAVPFHFWAPDVYQGSPTPFTGYMAAVAKAAGFAGLLRVLNQGLISQQVNWRPIIWIMAVLTLVVGSVLALAQRDLKRMFAYSSISQAGYVLVGVEAASNTGTSGALFYLFTYTFIIIGTFAVVSIIEGRGEARTDLGAIRGLSRARPWLAAAMLVFLLAQAGVPFTSGFLAKFYVIEAAVQKGQYSLAIIAMLAAAVAAFFYLRVALLMYGSEPAEATEPAAAPAVPPGPVVQPVPAGSMAERLPAGAGAGAAATATGPSVAADPGPTGLGAGAGSGAGNGEDPVMAGLEPVPSLDGATATATLLDPPVEEDAVQWPMALALAVCAVFTIFAGVSSPIIDFARHATTFV